MVHIPCGYLNINIHMLCMLGQFVTQDPKLDETKTMQNNTFIFIDFSKKTHSISYNKTIHIFFYFQKKLLPLVIIFLQGEYYIQIPVGTR